MRCANETIYLGGRKINLSEFSVFYKKEIRFTDEFGVERVDFEWDRVSSAKELQKIAASNGQTVVEFSVCVKNSWSGDAEHGWRPGTVTDTGEVIPGVAVDTILGRKGRRQVVDDSPIAGGTEGAPYAHLVRQAVTMVSDRVRSRTASAEEWSLASRDVARELFTRELLAGASPVEASQVIRAFASPFVAERIREVIATGSVTVPRKGPHFLRTDSDKTPEEIFAIVTDLMHEGILAEALDVARARTNFYRTRTQLKYALDSNWLRSTDTSGGSDATAALRARISSAIERIDRDGGVPEHEIRGLLDAIRPSIPDIDDHGATRAYRDDPGTVFGELGLEMRGTSLVHAAEMYRAIRDEESLQFLDAVSPGHGVPYPGKTKEVFGDKGTREVLSALATRSRSMHGFDLSRPADPVMKVLDALSGRYEIPASAHSGTEQRHSPAVRPTAAGILTALNADLDSVASAVNTPGLPVGPLHNARVAARAKLIPLSTPSTESVFGDTGSLPVVDSSERRALLQAAKGIKLAEWLTSDPEVAGFVQDSASGLSSRKRDKEGLVAVVAEASRRKILAEQRAALENEQWWKDEMLAAAQYTLGTGGKPQSDGMARNVRAAADAEMSRRLATLAEQRERRVTEITKAVSEKVLPGFEADDGYGALLGALRSDAGGRTMLRAAVSAAVPEVLGIDTNSLVPRLSFASGSASEVAAAISAPLKRRTEEWDKTRDAELAARQAVAPTPSASYRRESLERSRDNLASELASAVTARERRRLERRIAEANEELGDLPQDFTTPRLPRISSDPQTTSRGLPEFRRLGKEMPPPLLDPLGEVLSA